MLDTRDAVMPRRVRAAQLLLFGLAFVGLIVVLAMSGGLTSYGLGQLIGAWFLVRGCALLALTYGGRARGGVRIGAAAPAGFTDAALRIVLGVPAVVLLFLPEATAWFDREK